MTPKKVQEATTNELSDFLMDTFDAVHSGLSDRKKADMAGYALLAQGRFTESALSRQLYQEPRRVQPRCRRSRAAHF